MPSIYYRKRRTYKYFLDQNYQYPAPGESALDPLLIPATEDIKTPYINLTTGGVLTIKQGYAWDGPSGPTIDSADFMRGSLVHDALYQLMREGYLDRDQCRDAADRLLQAICIADGMSQVRAKWVYEGVQHFGAASAASDLFQAP